MPMWYLIYLELYAPPLTHFRQGISLRAGCRRMPQKKTTRDSMIPPHSSAGASKRYRGGSIPPAAVATRHGQAHLGRGPGEPEALLLQGAALGGGAPEAARRSQQAVEGAGQAVHRHVRRTLQKGSGMPCSGVIFGPASGKEGGGWP